VARMNQARMLWTNARFGDQPFQFNEDGETPQKGLWAPFALAWMSFVIAPFAFFMTIGIVTASYVFTHRPVPGQPPTPEMIAIIVAGYVGGALVGFLIWMVLSAPYNAAAMNRVASLISIDGARFRLRAKTFSLFWITLAGWLIILLSV